MDHGVLGATKGLFSRSLEETASVPASTDSSSSSFALDDTTLSPDKSSPSSSESTISKQISMKYVGKQYQSDPFPRRCLRRCPLTAFKGKTGRAPKHEYFVAMVIRGLKKAIKKAGDILTNRPCCGIFSLLKDKEKAEKWQQFYRKVTTFHRYIDVKALCTTVSCTQPSFNKQFIRRFYDSPYVRVAHLYFIDMIFSASPEELAAAWKISCCEGGHSEACIHLWQQLRDYAAFWMIKEVGLDPYLEG